MNSPSTAVQVAQRVAVLLLVLAAGWAALRLTADDNTGGANIGAGLAIFACCALLALAVGFVDGRRLDRVRGCLVWLLTGAAFGLVSVLALWLLEVGSGGWDWSVLLSDLLVVAPFTAALAAGPGVVGVLVGGAGRDPSLQ